MKLLIAYNIITGLFFVDGQGFTAYNSEDATRLSEGEYVMVNHTWDNVGKLTVGQPLFIR